MTYHVIFNEKQRLTFFKNLCFQVQYLHIKAVDTNILMCECTITTSSSVTDYNIAG